MYLLLSTLICILPFSPLSLVLWLISQIKRLNSHPIGIGWMAEHLPTIKLSLSMSFYLFAKTKVGKSRNTAKEFTSL